MGAVGGMWGTFCGSWLSADILFSKLGCWEAFGVFSGTESQNPGMKIPLGERQLVQSGPGEGGHMFMQRKRET